MYLLRILWYICELLQYLLNNITLFDAQLKQTRTIRCLIQHDASLLTRYLLLHKYFWVRIFNIFKFEIMKTLRFCFCMWEVFFLFTFIANNFPLPFSAFKFYVHYLSVAGFDNFTFLYLVCFFVQFLWEYLILY